MHVSDTHSEMRDVPDLYTILIVVTEGAITTGEKSPLPRKVTLNESSSGRCCSKKKRFDSLLGVLILMTEPTYMNGLKIWVV